MEVRFGAVLVMAVPLLIAFESFSGSEIRGALRDYLEHPSAWQLGNLRIGRQCFDPMMIECVKCDGDGSSSDFSAKSEMRKFPSEFKNIFAWLCFGVTRSVQSACWHAQRGIGVKVQ